MNKLKNLLSSGNSERNRQATKGGSYSLAVTAVVLAILVVVNIFVSALPTHLTRYDISSSQLYSITSNTKAVVNALQEDVTIYWIVQSDKEDEIIQNLLGKYEIPEPVRPHCSGEKESRRVSRLCRAVHR